jgi:drug/metabolite transporter (DMT)-like permease
MLSFLLLAFLAPVMWALSNLIDRYILSKKLRDPFSYNIITIGFALTFVILIFLSVKVSTEFDAYFYGTLVGLTFSALYILYNKAMATEEGSRVVSLIYTMPIYVAIFSKVFLGEVLGLWTYVGIALLTLSAVLVSYKKITKKTLLTSGLVLILIYAIFSAATRVISKSALADVDVWSYLFWAGIGETVGAMLMIAAPGVRHNLKRDIATIKKETCVLLFSTELFTFMGFAFFYMAISIGSVSIASSVTALQPFIFLTCALVLTEFFPRLIKEEVDRSTIYLKLAAVILIVIGTLLVVNL